MSTSAIEDIEFVVRTIAETVVANEEYFGQLDAVVGDGDFGYSLARGFERVLEGMPAFDRGSAGAFLKKVGLTIASRMGGTSGPLWGTAFLRAGAAAGSRQVLAGEDVAVLLRAAADGIQERGGAVRGEKTLLDALLPLIETFEMHLSSGDPVEAFAAAAEAASKSAAETSALEAKRGRASYAGSRSIGSPDAGAIAIGVIAQSVQTAWRNRLREQVTHA